LDFAGITEHILFPWLFSIPVGIYFLVLLGVLVGLLRLREPTQSFTPRISVVIAARNEADRIQACLNSLEQLDYPEDRYEIILVDDHSTDATPRLIQQYCTRHPNWKFIPLNQKSSELRGKKHALLTGIAAARGEIIFTTDADCVVPPGWLRHMSRYFENDVTMVLGYSPLIERPGVWHKLLAFDNLFSAIVAAAPTQLGHPISSVGRNLAYRKDAYNDVGSFLALKKFRSGDDVHLTERFRFMKVGKIVFCAHPQTFVATLPPATLKEIFHAQLRKHSKIFKQTPSAIAFSLGVFLSYCWLTLFPLFAPQYLTLWLYTMGAKFLMEFVDLTVAARIFRQTQLVKYFPLMQIIYPFYIFLFSFLGAFDIYRWKE